MRLRRFISLGGLWAGTKPGRRKNDVVGTWRQPLGWRCVHLGDGSSAYWTHADASWSIGQWPASDYGYLVWLNQQGSLFKSAPKSSWFALGAGSSVTWVDQTLELVVIMRWIDAAKTNDCIDMIMSALVG